MTDLTRAKKIAEEAVRTAGAIVLDNFTKVSDASMKGRNDLVTQIDVDSEQAIIATISKHFPDHGIISEEQGGRSSKSEYTWIIDPIDGTINYFYGSAPFRVGICLTKNGQPILSTIYNPLKDELYTATQDQGAYVNGQRVKVNDNFELKNSVVMTHLSSNKGARARTILALESIFNKTMHMRIYGSGLAAMTYVASGKFDVFFNVHTNPWDILPGALLIQEAGGVVTDIHGGKITQDTTSVLATNGTVHEQMLKLLEEV